MRRRIFWGVLLAAIVALLIGLTAGAVIRQQQLAESSRELNRQAAVTAELLSSEIGPSLRAENDRSVSQTLRQIRLIGGYDYLEVAVITPDGINTINADAVLLPQFQVGVFEERGVRRVEVDGTPVFATVRNVQVGRIRLMVAIGQEDPLLGTGAFTRPLVVGLIAGVILALLVSLLVSRRLGRRLAGLEEAAVGLAGGDYAARAPIDGEDDIAQLGAAFNYMAASLQQAQRRERDFLMSVGHDLRTPLTTIRGYAEGLEAGLIEPDALPKVADVLHRQTDRLSRLIEDLMLLARLEAREFTLRPEHVDLAAHVSEIVDAHRVRSEKLDVRFESYIEPVGIVHVDPDRIAQILGNLVDNALRYTPEGGAVRLSMSGNQHEVVFEVADTGPGMDEEDISRVFERLYVAQRYRPVRPEGSGLGLTIVKELVDALKGRVEVKAKPGRGTTVKVILPVSSPGSP